MRVPLADIATEKPELSPAASPSMSDAVCNQAPLTNEKTRAWSALMAPMTMWLPSADMSSE